MNEATRSGGVMPSLYDRQLQMSLVYDNVVDIVFVVNLDDADRFFFAAANRRFFQVTGLREDQVIGRAVDEVIPPSSRDLVIRNYRKAMQTREAVSWEETSHYPTGTKVGEVTVVPVVESDGSCRQLAGVVHDVTEYRRLLAELESTEERWRLALQGSGAGVWDWHVAEDRITLSSTWRNILGYGSDEVESAYVEWEKRIHPDDKPAVMRGIEALLRKQSRSYQSEHRLQHANGTWVWVHSHAMAVYNQLGKLERLVGTITDVSHRKQAEETIWRQANTDSLTNLPNRNHFTRALQDTVQEASDKATGFALLLVDLDRFKEVNDSMGHSAGDRLLQEAARRLRASIPDEFLVARLGGDEFGVIFNGDTQTAHRLAEDLIAALRAPYSFGLRQAHLTASAGIARYPSDGSDSEALIKQADQAMYYAKGLSGNRLAYFSPDMQERVDSRQKLIVDLHRALSGEQFRMKYQPIVELASGKVVKAEALIRWRHPQDGDISPSIFIPLAEEVGVIDAIGNWVLERALREFQPMLGNGCQLAINASSRQFADGSHYTDKLFAALAELNIDPAQLVLELTETVLLDLDERKLAKFQRLRDAGVKLALDDFGTGYSSLSYITRLKFDFLKIDRVFTRSIEQDPTSLALCETMVSMAHKLGMKVIAEGIENRNQRNILAAAGCDFGQGFLFAPALELDQFSGFGCSGDGRAGSLDPG